MSNSTLNSSAVTVVYVSTLLIPERVVWLPYAGLIMTVLIWLGYDFYRFHGNNKQKYVRMAEHLTILRSAPSRQRISMVSGIGLRFKRGKPILGDVWNTSPSSSDVSSCYRPRRRGLVAYSREVTPSDEGGVYSETDLFAGSSLDLVENEVHNTHQGGGWEVGGEYVKGNLGHMSRMSADDGQSNYTCLGDPQVMASKSQHDGPLVSNVELPAVTSTQSSLPVHALPISTSSANGVHFSSGGLTACASAAAAAAGGGGGVYDGGGGRNNRTSRDVATQTTFCDFMMNVISDHSDENLNQGHSYLQPGQKYFVPPGTPRQHRNSVPANTGYLHYPGGLSHDHTRPLMLDFMSQHQPARSRSIDFSANSAPVKHNNNSSGKSEKRPQPLRLDLLSPPYSPTAEIVATKHGFTLEGLEVPHCSAHGGRSIPSSGSEIFRPSDSDINNSTLLKPLTPSPAVAARVSSSRQTSYKQSVSHSLKHSGESYSHPLHHHRHKRSSGSSTRTSSKTSSKHSAQTSSKHSAQTSSKHSAQTLSFQTRHPRAMSSSPRLMKEWDECGESVSLKTLKHPSTEPPQSAPIPSHLYHQDEEGFFSSVTSASQARRMYRDDFSNKGILFFSRLAGIGRHQDQGMMGAERRLNSVSYKTGGFES